MVGLGPVLGLPLEVDVQFFGIEPVDISWLQSQQLAEADPEEENVNDFHSGILDVAKFVLPALPGLLVPVFPREAVHQFIAL